MRRARRTNKYGVAARADRTYRGAVYASKAEAARAAELDLLMQAGSIASWEPQPRFELGCPENVYIADFLVRDSEGAVWVEDVKGHETAKFRHDKRLWKQYGPQPLRILKRVGRRWKIERIDRELRRASS